MSGALDDGRDHARRWGWLSATAVALLMVATTHTAYAGDPSAIPSSPTGSRPAVLVASEFGLPFEYVAPWASDMRAAVTRQDLYGFFHGEEPPEWSGGYGNLQQPAAGPYARGVAVAILSEPVTHPCPMDQYTTSRVPIRRTPGQLLEDLHDIGGLAMRTVTNTMLDGRPALAADFETAAVCGGGDVHIAGAGIGGDFLVLAVPSRLIVADIDGVTTAVLIWAATPDGLAGWLPEAMEFVDSIHFIPPASPSPSASTGP